ncbi:ead/Ea22-like family protein [Escherichia coli]|uniref:ead/Ea22-like family protein n=1 Tax=Escherichia coli TaxID=562 RepID=UPI0023425B82|nr:ead/Ea22-like family protein [Escherichia coli]
MSKIDYQVLREAAEKATKGSYIVGHTSVNKHGNLTGVFVCQKWKGEPGGVIAECHVNCLVETDAQAYANAEFIAAFNPKIALALLDEREAKDKVWSVQDNHINQQADRIESLEKKNGDLGRALEAAEKRIAELEAKLDSADKLQDSAFRHGLQHGFSLGQTDNQAGFEECLSAYGTGKGE